MMMTMITMIATVLVVMGQFSNLEDFCGRSNGVKRLTSESV